jgi:hypothetical protein
MTRCGRGVPFARILVVQDPINRHCLAAEELVGEFQPLQVDERQLMLA